MSVAEPYIVRSFAHPEQ